MSTAAAISLLLALAAEPGGEERLLLCRASVRGEPGLARAEALPAAARDFPGRFVDYGVACEGEAEAARAARRAGIGHAVSALAEGRTEGSRFELALTAAEAERALARRTVEVAPGADPVPSLRRSLEELLASLPRPPPARLGPWISMGAGAALVVASAGFALAARESARARDRAGARGDWRGYVERDASWRGWRTAGGVSLGLGGAALGAGIAWRFAF